MTQKDLLEASDSLRQWFKRGGTDPKTGKKFKGQFRENSEGSSNLAVQRLPRLQDAP